MAICKSQDSKDLASDNFTENKIFKAFHTKGLFLFLSVKDIRRETTKIIMKKYSIIFTLLLLNISSQAQVSGHAFLDANKVSARINVAGDMFFDPVSSYNHYNFPNGSIHHSAYASSLWIGGYDQTTSELKVAAQTYRQSGMDYWAGPLDVNNNAQIDTPTSQNWDQIWKVTQNHIDSFLGLSSLTLLNIPKSILEWPAIGNIHSKTPQNATLVIPNRPMAPFHDVNSDGIYNALDGDYPKIKGDQMLWWVFNDNRPHGETGSNPLKLEIQATAWACAAPSVENMTFYNYSIHYYGTSVLDSTVIGIWQDAELGYGFDDFIGFDSTYRMGICYNGDSVDNSPNGYGTSLTQNATVLLQTANDILISNGDPVGRFTTYDNHFAATGNPVIKEDFYGYMTGTYKDGSPILSCGNPGKYVYPDDPSIIGGCSEVQYGNTPFDSRYVLSSSHFTMTPGMPPIELTYAVINTDTGSYNGNFNALRQEADSAYAYVDGCNFSVNFPLGLIENTETIFSIYPNPAKDVLVIEDTDQNDKTISLFNSIGQRVLNMQSNQGKTNLDISHLARGLYIIEVLNDEKQFTQKVMIK